REGSGLLARSALPVDGRARHVLGKPGGEECAAGDVVALLADLADAAADDVVDEGRIEVVAADNGVEHPREEVDRMRAAQHPARLAAPTGGADDVDNDGFSAHAD